MRGRAAEWRSAAKKCVERLRKREDKLDCELR